MGLWEEMFDRDALNKITEVINSPDNDEHGGMSIFDAYHKIVEIVGEVREVKQS